MRADEKETSTKSSLIPTERDSKFLGMHEMLRLRFNKDFHENVMLGIDVIVDCRRLAVFPVTPRGRLFVEFIKRHLKWRK